MRFLFLLLLALASSTACKSTESSPPPTGFLSNYFDLEEDTDGVLRYVNPDNGLENYSKFLVDPVEVYFHETAEGRDLGWASKRDIGAYFHGAVRKAISREAAEDEAAGTRRVRSRMRIPSAVLAAASRVIAGRGPRRSTSSRGPDANVECTLSR